MSTETAVSGGADVDAVTRLTTGDWAGESLSSLKAKGLIVRDPACFSFYLCPTAGMRYTMASLQGAENKARYARRLQEASR